MKKDSGACKGICKKFKAKRPPNGKRYEAGQMRCQICEIFIYFKGTHTKEGLPATEDTVGAYCNCCNYRVRKNPRNKGDKEKLRESKADNETLENNTANLNTDKINRLISESLTLIRKDQVGIYEKNLNEELEISEKEFQQILPRLLRLEDIVEETEDWGTFSKKILKSVKNQEKNEIKDIPHQMVQDETLENNTANLNTDKINRLISESLTLIRKDQVGIYEKNLNEELEISEKEFQQILPRLLRLEDIVEETEDWGTFSKKILKSVKNQEKNELNIISKTVSTHIPKDYNEKNEIKDISHQMVQEYLHWKTKINKSLKRDAINAFLKYRSLSKVYSEFPNHTKEKIRSHLVTDSRIPVKLKKMENTMELHSDPRCSITIALYATDYFHWDGEEEKEDKVIELSKNISRYLQSDVKLNQLFLGKR